MTDCRQHDIADNAHSRRIGALLIRVSTRWGIAILTVLLRSRSRIHEEQIKKPKEVKTDEVYLSRQNWYLRFFLPNETYAVAKGTSFQGKTDIRLNEEPFLHDGYLLV